MRKALGKLSEIALNILLSFCASYLCESILNIGNCKMKIPNNTGIILCFGVSNIQSGLEFSKNNLIYLISMQFLSNL